MTNKAAASSGTDPAAMADMAPLIRRVRDFLEEVRDRRATVSAPFDTEDLEKRFGLTARRRGRAEMILAEDAAVELGHPASASLAMVLTTSKPGLVRSGRITIVGPDLDRLDGRQPFGQIVMAAVDPDRPPDPFDLENAQFLINRLPGWAVRSIPGRLWVRVSRRAVQSGLSLAAVGSALIPACSR